MPKHDAVRRGEYTVSGRVRGKSPTRGEVDGGKEDAPQTTMTDGADGEAPPNVIAGDGGESQVRADGDGRPR